MKRASYFVFVLILYLNPCTAQLSLLENSLGSIRRAVTNGISGGMDGLQTGLSKGLTRGLTGLATGAVSGSLKGFTEGTFGDKKQAKSLTGKLAHTLTGGITSGLNGLNNGLDNGLIGGFTGLVTETQKGLKNEIVTEAHNQLNEIAKDVALKAINDFKLIAPELLEKFKPVIYTIILAAAIQFASHLYKSVSTANQNPLRRLLG